MSFFRHGEIYQSDERGRNSGERPKSRPRLIVPMSLPTGYFPRRVAAPAEPASRFQPSANPEGEEGT